ncbi:MAG: CDP-2,3-bis-(O-geranylgeranyl)-sn-glycerol synthase [Nanoarchaeota archaeon]
MANIILQCVYFILPAYFANMAPVIVKDFFKKIAIPLDFGKTLGDKPIFGEHKTFRGLIFGVLFAIILTHMQYLLYQNNIFTDFAIVDYSNWLLIGFLLGLGAMIGDLIKSFLKRRLGYEPGKPFIPFDQTDFIIGALAFTYPITKLSFYKMLIIWTVSFVLHIIVNHIAFYTGIRREKW